mgnify:CR=1 FL=1
MHKTDRFYAEEGPVSRYFGQNVLDLDKMRGYMSQEAYEAVLASVKFGAKLDRSVSNEIASGMKSWAIEMGATHYTHLFQPLTDSTAEKHEAFISFKDGKAFEKFNGSALVQQEPDVRFHSRILPLDHIVLAVRHLDGLDVELKIASAGIDDHLLGALRCRGSGGRCLAAGCQQQHGGQEQAEERCKFFHGNTSISWVSTLFVAYYPGELSIYGW